MKFRKKAIIMAILAAFALVSCGKKEQAVDNSRPVKVEVLGQNNLTIGYNASGEIKGIEEIPYTATSSGEVIAINAQNGDLVNAGQIIVAIDNQTARSNVRSAQANVDTASANIGSARASLEEARINFEKYRNLYNKRLVTETEYLSAQTAYNSARANLEAMQNSLSSANASLADANDVQRKTVIPTNVTGTIANMDLELHQQVANGDKLFTLVNESEMKLELGVSPQVISRITVGAEARVTIDELNNQEVVGQVYEISSAIDSATKQYIVKIRIPNPDRIIKSGMYGKASINTGVEEGLVIPKKSIVVKGVNQIVYVIRDGKAVAINVKISNQNDTYAAVTGEGLQAGDQLVVDGQNVLQADEKVRIVQ